MHWAGVGLAAFPLEACQEKPLYLPKVRPGRSHAEFRQWPDTSILCHKFYFMHIIFYPCVHPHLRLNSKSEHMGCSPSATLQRFSSYVLVSITSFSSRCLRKSTCVWYSPSPCTFKSVFLKPGCLKRGLTYYSFGSQLCSLTFFKMSLCLCLAVYFF